MIRTGKPNSTPAYSANIEQRGYTPEKAIATFLHSNLGIQEYEFQAKMMHIHLHCSDEYHSLSMPSLKDNSLDAAIRSNSNPKDR